jgi:hypothetical protein
MVEPSKHWTEYLAVAVEIAAALVIALAVGEAVFRAVPLLLRYSMPQQAKVDVRLAMGGAGWRSGWNSRSRPTSCGRQLLQAGVTSASSQPSPHFERT